MIMCYWGDVLKTCSDVLAGYAYLYGRTSVKQAGHLNKSAVDVNQHDDPSSNS